ncbi:MAG: CHRD domain-containing protein [candidate division Zixibacteria bacterium]|jgi:plastocyanin|nr:CHRD domain-containing protein [candidate division Zixibacteria bacterium]
MNRRLRALATAAALLCVSVPVRATIHTVQVGNFFFNPTKTTVNPGDTVRWVLVSGVHTTTSMPSSPKQWDSGILSGSFDVVFTAGDGPGPFPYLCSVHPTTMIDTIFMAVPAEPTRFAFVLGQSQADACAGTGSTARGYGLAVLSPDSTELSLYIVHDVSSPTLAHVHRGAPCVSGPVAFGFSSPASPISDTWSLTPADVQDLFDGDLYVNVHSSTFGDGEIRGQIIQDDIRFLFNLDESQADGGSGTGSFATGFGEAVLSADATEMSFVIGHDVASPIDAHVHIGAPGVEGPVRFGFTSFTSPITGTWTLDTTHIKELFNEELYVNVHSNTFLTGEIRGQVRREVARFAFRLTESEANGGAGTGSSATGYAICDLSADQESMSILVEHDIASAIDGHVHLGAPGVEGPPVFAFSSSISPINETWPLTPTDIANLLAGDLYINIHSTAFPSGEIRGQLLQAPTSLNVGLDESQANLCAGTGSSATGTVSVVLKPEGRQLTVVGTHDVGGATDVAVELGFPCIDGPALFSLGASSSIADVLHLSSSDVSGYLRGELNLTVTSATFPDGEIRGQIATATGTACCTGNTGNINDDAGGAVDLSDLIYLVNFLFLGGPSPTCVASANTNGDVGCNVDLSDLIYLVNFLFLGGPSPAPCDPACE